MERRLNLASVAALAVLLLTSFTFAANTNQVSGKKFCVRHGGTDGMVLTLSQQPSSHTPTTEPSGDGDPDIEETCYDSWYDETATHTQGTYPDAYSYLKSAMGGAHGALELLTDIDFGGTNADGSCAITFRPLPDDNYNGFFGHGNTIKNLCLKLDGIPSDYYTEYASDGVLGIGFFSTLSGMYVDSVNFENVDIEVKNDYSGLVVRVGAAVGVANGSRNNFTNISLKNVKIVAAQAGGLVGSTMGREATFRDVIGESVEVYASPDAVTPSIDETMYIGMGNQQWKMGVAIGGLVGVMARGGTIVNVGISGLNVHSSADEIDLLPQLDEDPVGHASVEQSIGGIVGRAEGVDGSDYFSVHIVNTYTVGDVSMPDNKYNGSCRVGFLAGTLILADGMSATSSIGVNYHYGEDDYLASALGGYITIGETDITNQWATYNFGSTYTHSYRNAIDVSIPEGDGVLSANYMKTDEFAYTLNSSIHFTPPDMHTTLAENFYTSEWSRKTGVNSGLPVFASESLKPIYQVIFTVEGSAFVSLSSTDKQKMKSAGAVDLLDQDPEVPVVVGSKMSTYTNYAGKLTNTTWVETAAQIAGTAYNWNYQDKSGRILPFAVKTSTVYGSDMYLSLTGKKSVTVQYGFVESGNGDWFYSVESYAESHTDLFGGDPYFMGNPVTEITSDSVWSRIPYLAVYNEREGAYQYFEFSLRKKTGCYEEDWGYDEPVELCSFTSVDVSSVGQFFTDGLSEFSDGDTLYVVYSDYPSTYDPSANTRAPGGYLFVADLHGNGFGMEAANVQVKGVDGNGDRVLFGYSEYLNIRSEAVEDVLDALSGVSSTMMNVPYSPYVTVDYPSSAWESVEDVVALVVVGYLSASSADDWVVGVTGALADTRMEGKLPKDTLAALEAPDEILREIRANEEETVQYVRYLATDKDGNLDLTNLFAALELAKKAEYRYEYPVFVGFLPRTKAITYHVTFDFDMLDKSSFYVANRWLGEDPYPEKTYTRENAEGDFIEEYGIGLLSLDGCNQRLWSFTSEASRDNDEPVFVGLYDAIEILSESERYEVPPYTVNKDGSRSLTVYAVWQRDPNECRGWPNRTRMAQGNQNQVLVWNNAVIEDKSTLGNVVLQQKWRGNTLRHVSTSLNEGVTGMYVPYADSLDYVFEVYADGYPGYEVDGDILFSKQGEYDDEPTTIKLKEGDTLRLGGFGLTDYTMWFSADYTYKKFTIQFVTGKADVFYGENSDSVGVYKLKSKNDAIDLPKWVYTEDNCVDGWMWHPESVDKDPYLADFAGDGVRPVQEENVHDNWTTVFDEFNFALSEELDNQLGNRLKEYPLYAVWVDAKTCVKDLGYKQARLNIAENGLVKFKELVRDSDGKVLRTQVHQFAKDSTMLLPSYVDGANFVVLGASAKGYILDSLVMILNGDTSVYHEGDTLAGDIALATFEAYFMLDNTTPAEFVKAELLQSGSAIRFEFVTSEFGVSGASVKIVLEDDDGKAVADTVLAVPATPYADSWEYFPLRAGTYLLTATVKNSKSSDVFEKDFEVKSTIASKKDGWQMLSLSNVIMDSVTWDDDVRFFWWDDARDYGAYWRYQRLTRKDKVDDLTGYWYSSLEGRPLVMRKDMKPPKSPVVWDLDSVYTGWNLVANPYGWYVDLYGENQEQKKSSIEKSDIEFWSWNDSLSAYEEVDVVGPYEAVWAKVKAPGKWKLPSKPDFVAAVDENGNDSLTKPLKKTVELASNRRGNWAIRAVLRDAKGKRDGWNIMGVSESGWSAEEPPAGMGDHVNLSIKDGNRSLAKSFKAASGDSYEWTVSLDASGNRTGYLHFEGLEAVREAGLKVFVTVDGTTTQMAENDTLKVAIGSMAKTATVRVAPSARTIVAQKLNGLRAFQSGNALQVGFQVSESLEGARAYVEILDMKGKVLSSVSGTAVSGSNSMTLQAPKSGLYMVRVRVGSKQAAGSIAVK